MHKAELVGNNITVYSCGEWPTGRICYGSLHSTSVLCCRIICSLNVSSFIWFYWKLYCMESTMIHLCFSWVGVVLYGYLTLGGVYFDFYYLETGVQDHTQRVLEVEDVTKLEVTHCVLLLFSFRLFTLANVVFFIPFYMLLFVYVKNIIMLHYSLFY